MDIYQDKYNEIAISKEKLLAEKRTLEVTLTDEKALKKRLEGFKKLLESNKYLEEFDRAVFESIVDKIIIGGTNDEGEIDPAMITIIYKTGKKDSQDGRLFKSRRKMLRKSMRKLTVNCILNQATRLIICIPILLTTHIESVTLLTKAVD